MKKHFFTISIFLLIALGTQAQKLHPQTTARVFETTVKDQSRIVLVYETGESEVIPLLSIKIFGGMEEMNKVLVENQKTINKMLNTMDTKGYDLTHLTNWGESSYLSFMVFTKRE